LSVYNASEGAVSDLLYIGLTIIVFAALGGVGIVVLLIMWRKPRAEEG